MNKHPFLRCIVFNYLKRKLNKVDGEKFDDNSIKAFFLPAPLLQKRNKLHRV